jgi:hypothetical protein
MINRSDVSKKSFEVDEYDEDETAWKKYKDYAKKKSEEGKDVWMVQAAEMIYAYAVPAGTSKIEVQKYLTSYEGFEKEDFTDGHIDVFAKEYNGKK